MNKMNLICGIGNCVVATCAVAGVAILAKAHKESLKERDETDTTDWINVRDRMLVSFAEASLVGTSVKSVCDAVRCFRHLK